MTKFIITLLVIGAIILGVWYFKGGEWGGLFNSDEHISQGVDEELVDTGWTWLRTERANGSSFVAPDGGRFVLTFHRNGSVMSTTDCNSMSGNYVRNGEVLSFSSFAQTLMFCEGSVETEYGQDLSYTNSYTIEGSELRLNLSRDMGTMVFTR